MLREYIWSLTFVALLLGTYTVIIWQQKSAERQPAAAIGASNETSPVSSTP